MVQHAGKQKDTCEEHGVVPHRLVGSRVPQTEMLRARCADRTNVSPDPVSLDGDVFLGL